MSDGTRDDVSQDARIAAARLIYGAVSEVDTPFADLPFDARQGWLVRADTLLGALRGIGWSPPAGSASPDSENAP